MSGGPTRSHFDPSVVASTVGDLPRWPFGRFRAERAVRIGVEHGLSGTAHRVIARTEAGERVTFVVKQDGAEGVERALAFDAALGERLAGSIPTCYGGSVNVARGTGTLYLEDVSPARQGDVLIDPGNGAAKAAMRTIARVHAASWRSQPVCDESTLPSWHSGTWDEERLRDRLMRARSRFPDLLTDAVESRLGGLLRRVEIASMGLGAGPASWIHSDAHLDNFLWRENGDAVLLDWAGAMIGPPAVDVARFLVEGPPGIVSDGGRVTALMETYRAQLLDGGVPERDVAMVPRMVGLAVAPLAQSILGWAGRPEDRPLEPRMERLRRNALRGVVAWLDRRTTRGRGRPRRRS